MITRNQTAIFTASSLIKALVYIATALALLPMASTIGRADNTIKNSQSAAIYRDIQFGNTTYRLPISKYKIWVQPYNKEGDHAAFGFDAILPDILPATDDPVEAATWGTGTGWHKDIHILVEYGRNFISEQQMLENAFSESQDMKLRQDKDAKEGYLGSRFKYLDKNIYTKMQNDCKKYNGYAINSDTIQVCELDNSLLVIDCNTTEMINNYKLSPSCNVRVNIGNKTQLTYSYGYDYFDKATIIHNNLIILIKSFISK